MAPLVGVTSYTPIDEESKAYSLPHEYVHALQAAGADVVLLPGGDAGACLSRLDGLVLSGGGDIDPEVYGGGSHETTYMVDPVRDRFELELAGLALEREMPLLAICRGMQILNVHLGGDLVAHLPERFGDDVTHRQPPREPTPHAVTVDAGSRLAEVVGAGQVDVISWHHQAVDRLADGLRVVARAADGVPEAVELDGRPGVFAVQWHPELNFATSRAQARLFETFVNAASAFARAADDD